MYNERAQRKAIGGAESARDVNQEVELLDVAVI